MTWCVSTECRRKRGSRRERGSIFLRRRARLARQANTPTPAATTGTEGIIVAVVVVVDSAMMIASGILGKFWTIHLRMSVNAPDATHSDLFRPLLPNFTSLEFDDGLFPDMETGPISTLATPESESYATLATQTDASQTQVDKSRYLDSTLLQPVSSKGHDCFREAYDILGSLSFHRLNNAHSISESPPPGSASTTASTANLVPLDHVLRLNRETSERLGRLLTCSCAGFPQLTMLYASIISQVLIWYQQAAGCTQSASWSPADI